MGGWCQLVGAECGVLWDTGRSVLLHGHLAVPVSLVTNDVIAQICREAVAEELGPCLEERQSHIAEEIWKKVNGGKEAVKCYS